MGRHLNNNQFDQYYTSKKLAARCINCITSNVEEEYRQFYLEPSAGNGSFLQGIVTNKYLAIDIDPKAENVIKTNFLLFRPPEEWNKKVTTVLGNPPFGHAGNLAIKFFNHATSFANTICFILPRSFKKISIQNKLSLSYNLTFEEDIGNNGFVLISGCEYKTCSCVFQIWKSRENLPIRQKIIYNDNPYLVFCNKIEAIAAIRRTGGRAGQLVPVENSAESSTLFVKPQKDVSTEKMIEVIKLANLIETSDYTASVKAVSASEIHQKLSNLASLSEKMTS